MYLLCCRRQLTPNMPESAAEGILCDAEGRLLEGMITNVFIVAGGLLTKFITMFM